MVDGTPVVVVSHLRTYLFSQGDDPGADEPEVELLIAEDELVHVPIREISELFAAQGTPGGWEAHAKGRIDNGEEPDSKT